MLIYNRINIYYIWPVIHIINTLYWYGISVIIYESILMLLTKIHALFTFPYINFFCLPHGLSPYHFILIICHVVLGFWVLTFCFFGFDDLDNPWDTGQAFCHALLWEAADVYLTIRLGLWNGEEVFKTKASFSSYHTTSKVQTVNKALFLMSLIMWQR